MSDLLKSATEATARHAWTEVVEILSQAEREGEIGVDGYELLGQAVWWLGDVKRCIEAREKAYSLRLNDGDFARAGRLSLFLAEHYYYENMQSVSSYWYRTARDLLEQDKTSPQYGWLLRAEAQEAYDNNADAEKALAYAQQALDIALASGDENLECLSRHDIGRFKMMTGDTVAGLEMMESAMARVLSGGLEPLTSGRMFCNMIDACDQLVDYQRAVEWDSVAKNWCERVGHLSAFPGVCRVKRAGLMRRTGALDAAEKEAIKAKQELSHFFIFAARAVYELGEIRMRLGDLEGSEEAFREAHAMGFNPQPGLALLFDAQGKTKAAFELLESTLATTHLPLARVPILNAMGTLTIKLSRLDMSKSIADEITDIAAQFKSSAMEATAEHLYGLIAFANQEYDQALKSFQHILKYWIGSRLPYEVAQARLNIGNVYFKMGRAENARLEWESALREFERLGAKPDVEKVRKLIAKEQDHASTTQRKALMFTDIVGSTALISTIGDVAWKHLVQWHDRTLRALFVKCQGTEVDHAGDGFFVEFEVSANAVLCAQEIQRTLLRQRTTQGFAPNVRIGIHCAEVEHAGSTLIGLEVHRAARIASLADAGEVAASFEVVQELDSSLILERKSALVKGIETPVEFVLLDWMEK